MDKKRSIEEEYAVDSPSRSKNVALMTQEKTISELTDIVYNLLERLTPVLKPDYEESAKALSAENKEPIQSPFSQQLNSHNANLKKLSNKLASATERLEC